SVHRANLEGQGRLRPVGSALKNFAMVETGRSGGPTVAKVPEGRIPVVPEAIPLGPLSAQLRCPRPRAATSAIRRFTTFNHSRRATLGGPLPRRRGPSSLIHR